MSVYSQTYTMDNILIVILSHSEAFWGITFIQVCVKFDTYDIQTILYLKIISCICYTYNNKVKVNWNFITEC